jgi:hypothetical protein
MNPPVQKQWRRGTETKPKAYELSIMTDDVSRRDFLLKSMLAAGAVAASSSVEPALAGDANVAATKIPPEANPKSTVNESTRPTFADHALASRVEPVEAISWHDCAQAHLKAYPSSPLAVIPISEGYAVFLRAGSLHTHALGLGVNESVTEADLDKLERFYLERSVPPRIEFCPFTQQSFIGLLGNRCYRLTEYANVFYLTVPKTNIEPPPETKAEIRKIGPDEAELWASTVAEGFRDEEEVTRSDEETLVTFARLPATTCLIASVQGRPAGGAALYRYGNVGMLFRASTLPQFRKNGIHNRLIHTRTSLASSIGCDLLFLVAVPGSQSHRNAQRRGFQVAYTRATVVQESKS